MAAGRISLITIQNVMKTSKGEGHFWFVVILLCSGVCLGEVVRISLCSASSRREIQRLAFLLSVSGKWTCASPGARLRTHSHNTFSNLLCLEHFHTDKWRLFKTV